MSEPKRLLELFQEYVKRTEPDPETQKRLIGLAEKLAAEVSLSRRVTIPFLERFREPMLEGVKTCTSRTRKMAKPGDTFEAFGEEFTVSNVWASSLGLVRSALWKKEGVVSPEQFEWIWKKIHPRKGFNPSQMVYVHNFYLTKKGPPVEPKEPWEVPPYDEDDSAP